MTLTNRTTRRSPFHLLVLGILTTTTTTTTTLVQGQVPPVPRSICYDAGFTNAQAEVFCKEAYADVDTQECDESDPGFSADDVITKECVMRCDDDDFMICAPYGMECYSDLGCLIPYTTTYEGSGI
jgi:hypothetical protein|eukprot:CAMPEP_0195263768 /NCGR_PEP_ID=MMETSP0706-20130129/10491_1 /TAXON_ID=33640 /ORGANISM="Asterionellopsis glacialis, Strain CCMP134" /LENGTH=125 /DNA_ID=CAMNT_0040317991 /DNA_START=107 /DNA_END=484 /DNA_ORIENTATION=+